MLSLHPATGQTVKRLVRADYTVTSVCVTLTHKKRKKKQLNLFYTPCLISSVVFYEVLLTVDAGG